MQLSVFQEGLCSVSLSAIETNQLILTLHKYLVRLRRTRLHSLRAAHRMQTLKNEGVAGMHMLVSFPFSTKRKNNKKKVK